MPVHVVTTYPSGSVLLQILTALLDRAKQQQQGRALGSLAANTDFLQQLGIILLEAANEPGGTQLAEKTMQVHSKACWPSICIWLSSNLWAGCCPASRSACRSRLCRLLASAHQTTQ